MPFKDEYNPIFFDLITPATAKSNEILGRASHELLEAHRTKEDIRTVSGWLNVLEHLTSAQIVLGVLTGDNPNVFYELGIAHATQPKTRQVLIAEEGYPPIFDIKDLIFFPYKKELAANIEALAKKIADAINYHKIEEEKSVVKARALIGPDELEVIMAWALTRNFFLVDTPNFRSNYEGRYGVGSFERHFRGLTHLCHNGLLGLHTGKPEVEGGRIKMEYSYHWTGLGNQVLAAMSLIPQEEVRKRAEKLPPHFE